VPAHFHEVHQGPRHLQRPVELILRRTKKLFSNTGDHLNQYSRKHKSDIFSTHEPKLDESAERDIGSRVLYKNHFVIP
jgi:hypothetical protein